MPGRITQSSGWAFSLRDSVVDDDSDSAGEEAHSPPPLTVDEQIARDLDVGAREDHAQFKSNPWSIAKVNAETRKDLPPLKRPVQQSTVTRPGQSKLNFPVRKQAASAVRTNPSSTTQHESQLAYASAGTKSVSSTSAHLVPTELQQSQQLTFPQTALHQQPYPPQHQEMPHPAHNDSPTSSNSHHCPASQQALVPSAPPALFEPKMQNTPVRSVIPWSLKRGIDFIHSSPPLDLQSPTSSLPRTLPVVPNSSPPVFEPAHNKFSVSRTKMLPITAPHRGSSPARAASFSLTSPARVQTPASTRRQSPVQPIASQAVKLQYSPPQTTPPSAYRNAVFRDLDAEWSTLPPPKRAQPRVKPVATTGKFILPITRTALPPSTASWTGYMPPPPPPKKAKVDVREDSRPAWKITRITARDVQVELEKMRAAEERSSASSNSASQDSDINHRQANRAPLDDVKMQDSSGLEASPDDLGFELEAVADTYPAVRTMIAEKRAFLGVGQLLGLDSCGVVWTPNSGRTEIQIPVYHG